LEQGVLFAVPCRPRRSQQLLIQCAAATDQQSGDMKTVVQKITPGDVPFPWSEKDPFRLPVSIDRVQKMLITLGEQLGRLLTRNQVYS
jgi:hypothetical protein